MDRQRACKRTVVLVKSNPAKRHKAPGGIFFIMMHSDFFALSICAFSLLYVPFMIISQLRFAHVLQHAGYGNRDYFLWIKNNFRGAYVPLIGICIIQILGELVLEAYLSNTSLYEKQLFVGYFVVMLVIAAAIVVVFINYIKEIKIENHDTPLVLSPRFISVFLVSSAIFCVFMLVVNLFMELDGLIIIMPLLAPLFVLLANLFVRNTKLAEE